MLNCGGTKISHWNFVKDHKIVEEFYHKFCTVNQNNIEKSHMSDKDECAEIFTSVRDPSEREYTGMRFHGNGTITIY